MVSIDPKGLNGFHPGFSPNGAGPKGGFATPCTLKVARRVRAERLLVDDHIQHCEWSCLMITECGYSPALAWAIGVAKEVRDPVATAIKNLPSGGDVSWPSGRDISNNKQGRMCGQSGMCYASGLSQCKQCCEDKAASGGLAPDPRVE